MTVTSRAVNVVEAARRWAPLHLLLRDTHARALELVQKRGGREAVEKELAKATDELVNAVRALEQALRKPQPRAKKSRKHVDWGQVFGMVASVAGAASQAMQPKGIPPGVIDVPGQDVTGK